MRKLINLPFTELNLKNYIFGKRKGLIRNSYFKDFNFEKTIKWL